MSSATGDAERAGLHRLEPAAAGDVDDGPRRWRPRRRRSLPQALIGEPIWPPIPPRTTGSGGRRSRTFPPARRSRWRAAPVSSTRGRSRSSCRLPGARREELRAGQARGQLQDRVAVVVGSRRRAVPGGDPDVARRVDLGRGAAHPDGPVVADRHRLVVARASRRPRAPRRPNRCRSRSHRRCRRSRRRRCRCSGSDRCVAGWRLGPVRAGPRPRRGRRSRCTC